MSIVKDSVIYTSLGIVQKAFGFLLLPLYTYFLSPEDYGVLSVVTTVVSIASVLMLLSLHGAVSKYYYELTENTERLKKFIGTIVTAVLLFSLLAGFAFFILQWLSIVNVSKEVPFWPYMALGHLTIIFSPIYTVYQTLIQIKQEAKKYALNAGLFFLLNTALTLIFLIVLNLKAEGALLATCLTTIVFSVHAIVSLYRDYPVGIEKKELKLGLKYSLPLVPHSVSTWLINMVDRLLLSNISGTATVGLFSMGFQLANVMNIISSAFNQAYSPWLLKEVNSKSDKSYLRINNLIVLMAAAFSVIVLMGNSISTFVITNFLNERFHQSWKVVPFLLLGSLFSSIYVLYINIVFSKSTILIPVLTLIGAVVGLVLNTILIPQIGIIGASISNLCANVAISIGACIVAVNMGVVRLNWVKPFILVLFTSIIIITSYLVKLQYEELYLMIDFATMTVSITGILIIAMNEIMIFAKPRLFYRK